MGGARAIREGIVRYRQECEPAGVPFHSSPETLRLVGIFPQKGTLEENVASLSAVPITESLGAVHVIAEPTLGSNDHVPDIPSVSLPFGFDGRALPCRL
jgi:hypothetical protein